MMPPWKPDPAVTELAGAAAPPSDRTPHAERRRRGGSWRTLLLLLARPPEEVRADGGIARLWETAGGPSIDLEEIDYAEVCAKKAARGID